MSLEERGRFLDSDFNQTISMECPKLFHSIDPDTVARMKVASSSFTLRGSDEGETIASKNPLQTLSYRDSSKQITGI